MPDAYNPWGAPVFPTAADNAMQPETFVPQGVRDWTQQAAPKDYNILSQIAGSLGKALMYPGQVAQSKEPISTEDMVGPAFNLAGMLTLGAGAAPQEANALNMGIRAYHGSPHDFDKFDLSKIGTGEGAQAYGHGLYFAEAEPTAKYYRDILGGASNDSVGQLARQHLQIAGNDAVKAASDLRARAALERRDPFSGINPDEMQTAAEKLEAGWHPDSGHMYEVNINADPSHFLDWDKPLHQQPDQVKQALQDLGIKTEPQGQWTVEPTAKGDKWSLRNVWGEHMGTYSDKAKAEAIAEQRTIQHNQGGAQLAYQNLGGNSIYNSLDKGAASQALREAGIPGIKYLDQGSRGAGEGSSNYVVFNHDLIDIMRKYAVPGMLGAPILANAISEQKT